MKKSDKKLFLIAGGAAVLGYFLLRQGEAAISGVAGPIAGFAGSIAALPGAIAGFPGAIADLTPGVQAGAAGITSGVVDIIGAAGTGAVGGAAGAIWGGVQEISKPFPQPLRTHEPVLDVRQIPIEKQYSPAYQEAIGVPLITVEELEAGRGTTTVSPQPISTAVAPTWGPLALKPLPASEVLKSLTYEITPSSQYWVNPRTQEKLGAYLPGQTPLSVLDLRSEGIYPSIRGF